MVQTGGTAQPDIESQNKFSMYAVDSSPLNKSNACPPMSRGTLATIGTVKNNVINCNNDFETKWTYFCKQSDGADGVWEDMDDSWNCTKP